MTETAVAGLLAAAASLLLSAGAHAEEAVAAQLSIRNHRFEPAELAVPAGRPVVLRIRNLDAIPAEFESVTLRVERVIPGNSEGTVRLRPLAAGRYSFFDDFHPETQGALVVR